MERNRVRMQTHTESIILFMKRVEKGVFFVFVFWDKVPIFSPGKPASASRVLGL
jgi:hypothetical protein